MSDDNKNKNNQNSQDFIEENDDFADSMDMNFADTSMDDVPDDDLLDIDKDQQSSDFDDLDHDDFGDEWAEDFGSDDIDMGDENLGDEDFYPGKTTAGKSERNWFNIALFGGLGLVICFLIYTFILPVFIGDDDEVQMAQNQPVNTQSNDMGGVETAENNTQLAQQAVAPELAQIEESGGVLANPELVGDGIDEVQQPDPDAEGNAVFEAMNNAPAMAEDEINDIFAAIENLQGEQQLQEAPEAESDIISARNTPQTLPAPADEMPIPVDDTAPLEDLMAQNTETPRGPESMTQDTAADTMGDVDENTAEEPELADNQMSDETMPETSSATSPTQSESPTAADNVAMNARMDQIMARLDALARQVEEGANSQPQTNTQAAAPSADVAALEQTIRNLEQRVSELSKAKPVPQPTRQAAASRRAEPAPTPVQRAPQWQLRGASPGQAYVAESGTQNLRTISVGDSLNGLGRIQSIGQENGRWVVRGTSGTIRQ